MIPWIPAPPTDLGGPPIAGPLPQALPDPAPPCSPAKLQVRPTRLSALAGSIVYYVTLTNISTNTCSLKAHPTSVMAITPSGQTVPVSYTAPGNAGNYEPVAASNVPPGGSGILEMNADHSCQAAAGSGYDAHPAARLLIGLSTGGQLDVGPPLDERYYEFPCGVTVNSLGVQATTEQYAPSPFDGVTATLQLPATVRSGAVLDYTVTLLDTTPHAVELLPCLSYTEQLSHATSYTQVHYDLNCSAIGELQPHQPVRFQMRQPVDAHLPLGPANVAWTSYVIPHEHPGEPADEGSATGIVTITSSK